jgi:enamine deaminase RidA (YjgF/YER057c/UK114 family)
MEPAMSGSIRTLNPPTMPPPNGYSHVVEVTAPGRMIFVAGQLGGMVSGELAGDGSGTMADFRAQAEQAFVNLRAALSAAGADFSRVVKVTHFLTQASFMPALREVRTAAFAGHHLPASTAIIVAGLARPGALYEIEALAAV